MLMADASIRYSVAKIGRELPQGERMQSTARDKPQHAPGRTCADTTDANRSYVDAHELPPWGFVLQFSHQAGATFGLIETQVILAKLLSQSNVTLNDPRPVLPVAKVTTSPSFESMFQLERR
jgi:hypothetical protein